MRAKNRSAARTGAAASRCIDLDGFDALKDSQSCPDLQHVRRFGLAPSRAALILRVLPRIEPGGHHTSRFDAFMPDGELIHTGTQILRPVARKLTERGYDPATMLTMHVDGAPRPSFAPRPIGVLAGEKLIETDDRGFRTVPWTEPPKRHETGTYTPNSARVGGGPIDDGEAA